MCMLRTITITLASKPKDTNTRLAINQPGKVSVVVFAAVGDADVLLNKGGTDLKWLSKTMKSSIFTVSLLTL